MINECVRWISDAPRHRRGIRCLQVALGLALLFRTFTEAPFAAYFWGPEGLGQTSTQAMLGPLGIVMDRTFDAVWSVYLLLAVQGAVGLALIVGWRTRIVTAIGFVVFVSFEYRLHSITDGGDNVTRLALMYMVMLLPAGAKDPPPGSMRTFVHNLGVLLLGFQVLVMYFTTGIMKANGALWHQGTALYLIGQVEWFSLDGMRDMFKNPLVVVVATYSTVLWQVWFPMGVFTRFRMLFVGVGVLFHVGIGVFMGLVCFSTVMLGLELFLLTDAEHVKIAGWVRSARDRVVALWPASGVRGRVRA
ncbi:MAG: hypothetical protein K0V04_16710 [Deltaproteobacteria bacterium]|nr:hypothetical protein [Deltaproteobacteria bacterium]